MMSKTRFMVIHPGGSLAELMNWVFPKRPSRG